MKKMRGAVRLLVALMVAAFLGTGGWIGYTVYTQGGRWAANNMNNRLNSRRKSVGMGEISDRNGVVLAYTDGEGRRWYAKDKNVRRALSQTVGDQMSMSGTGVETFHAGTLLGLSGSIIDRTRQYLSGDRYQGDNIRLTVDAELCAYISQNFPSGKEGAVCLLNYKTGEILAMVSKPDYDPERLAGRQATADTTGSGYLNRCLQGQYTPGSAFKIVTLASALSYMQGGPDPGVESLTFLCEGPRSFGNSFVRCYDGEIHGQMSLNQAFAVSCNVTFASIAQALGAERLVSTAERLGFNDNFAFRDLILYESTIPTRIPESIELAWTGVGQGRLQVTPLHMAMIAGAVANNGVMQTPRLIQRVTGAKGTPRLRAAPAPYGQVLDVQVAQRLREYMAYAVKAGTGSRAALKGYRVCGKTGTAEVSDDKSVATNAWFVGFLDDPAHPYAIAVVVEQGGTGGKAAAPLAAKAFKKAIGLLGA